MVSFNFIRIKKALSLLDLDRLSELIYFANFVTKVIDLKIFLGKLVQSTIKQ